MDTEHAAVGRAEISPEGRTILLVEILDAPAAREDEEDDVVMYLEDLGSPFVASDLVRTIRAGDSPGLAQRCTESLGGIWARPVT
ncbi:hypothetical protein H4K36_00555 [Streptomyces sp. DHE7-1]|nr:hypothetical protein [Streptomyces sp. DHE7-1]